MSLTVGVLALQAAVGLLGFVLHVTADLTHRTLPFTQSRPPTSRVG